MLAHELLTAEDLWGMTDTQGKRELVRGELIDVPPPGEVHGGVAANIAIVLGMYVRRTGISARVLVESGYVLGRGPDTVRLPDVSLRFVAGPAVRTFIEGAPDLAVEIVSPSDRLVAMARKAEDYLEAGVRDVWIVDPLKRRVTVHRRNATPRTLGPDDLLDSADLLPGFEVRVGLLFD